MMIDFRAEYDALMANGPRGMPPDFSPETWWTDTTISMHARLKENDGVVSVDLGFVMTGDAERNWILLKELRESVWLALELSRLGRIDEAKMFCGCVK